LTFERAEEVASRNDTTPSLSAADDSDRERETPSNSGGAEPATGDPLSKIPLIKRLLANPRQPAE
jgi:hypothetical protein